MNDYDNEEQERNDSDDNYDDNYEEQVIICFVLIQYLRKHIENGVKLILILKCIVTLPRTFSYMLQNFFSVIVQSSNMVDTKGGSV